MSAGVSTIRAPGYRADAADCRPASDVEITSREKAGSAASSGAWKTLPERPKPATAVRMGRLESVVMVPRYPRAPIRRSLRFRNKTGDAPSNR